MKKQMPTRSAALLGRRALLQLLSSLAAVPLLPACDRSPYEVRVPRPVGLGNAEISVQFTARRSKMGFISPRARYAKKLEPKFNNLLLDNGFVIKQKTADLHLVVQVYELTTGATAGTASCELLVDMYDKYPGELQLKQEGPVAGMDPVFSLLVSAKEHNSQKGYPLEALAERAADRCLQLLVDYLVRSKSRPMT